MIFMACVNDESVAGHFYVARIFLWELTFAEPLIQFNHFRLLIYIHV